MDQKTDRKIGFRLGETEDGHLVDFLSFNQDEAHQVIVRAPDGYSTWMIIFGNLHGSRWVIVRTGRFKGFPIKFWEDVNPDVHRHSGVAFAKMRENEDVPGLADQVEALYNSFISGDRPLLTGELYG